MSYGVIASRSASVTVVPTGETGGSGSDLVLDRFLGVWGPAGVSGRLVLTRLHLGFIPHRTGRGMATMDLDLRDVHQVERSGGRLSRVLVLRTATHQVQVRSLGCAALVEEISGLARAARKLPLHRH